MALSKAKKKCDRCLTEADMKICLVPLKLPAISNSNRNPNTLQVKILSNGERKRSKITPIFPYTIAPPPSCPNEASVGLPLSKYQSLPGTGKAKMLHHLGLMKMRHRAACHLHLESTTAQTVLLSLSASHRGGALKYSLAEPVWKCSLGRWAIDQNHFLSSPGAQTCFSWSLKQFCSWVQWELELTFGEERTKSLKWMMA